MTIRLSVTALLLLAVSHVNAKPLEPKALARFDVGYAKCEQRFDHMRGHADEAYLGLYKIKVDEAGRNKLAEIRKKPAYKSEKALAEKQMSKPGAEVEKKLDQQCRVTWAQVAPPVPAQAASRTR